MGDLIPRSELKMGFYDGIRLGLWLRGLFTLPRGFCEWAFAAFEY